MFIIMDAKSIVRFFFISYSYLFLVSVLLQPTIARPRKPSILLGFDEEHISKIVQAGEQKIDGSEDEVKVWAFQVNINMPSRIYTLCICCSIVLIVVSDMLLQHTKEPLLAGKLDYRAFESNQTYI